MSIEKQQINTKKLVITALFTALTTISTIVIQIPLPFGYVNFGDVFVLLGAFLLGPIFGTISASIGSALADVIVGYAFYAPGTFIIKGTMALVAGLISKSIRVKIKLKPIALIIGGVVAELIMATGYFFYEAVILSYSWAATASIVGNLMQGVIGVALSVTITALLTSRKIPFLNFNEKQEKISDESKNNN